MAPEHNESLRSRGAAEYPEYEAVLRALRDRKRLIPEEHAEAGGVVSRDLSTEYQ
jgi:hypothetical protein